MKKLLFLLTTVMMVLASQNVNAQGVKFLKPLFSSRAAVAGCATTHAIRNMNHVTMQQQQALSRQLQQQTRSIERSRMATAHLVNPKAFNAGYLHNATKPSARTVGTGTKPTQKK